MPVSDNSGPGQAAKPVLAAPRASPMAPFRYRIFLFIWTASLASNFGGLIQAVGASWLMTSLSPTADVVALVQASSVLPIMVFSLAAGAIADVLDRRNLMLAAQCLALVFSAALTILTFMGMVTPWSLLVLTFLVGCGNALYGPAWQSSVGDMVPRSELPAAVALNSVGFNIARTVGPALGGLIVAAAGSQAAFLINTLSYIGLITVLIAWKRPKEERPLPPESIPGAMMAGLRYVHLSPAIRNVLVRAVLFGISASCVLALMPLIAKDQIGGGPSIYGLLLGAFGVGAVLSALSSTYLRAKFNAEQIVRIATLCFAICGLTAAFSSLLAPTMIGMVLGGAGWVLSLSTFNISVQLSVPRWVTGRAVAVYQTLTFGGMALGAWMWGELAHRYGLPAALASTGGVLLVSLVLGRFLPMPAGSGENLDLRRPENLPVMNDAVPHRGGYVVITIEYRVPHTESAAFAEAMTHLRRVRQRNGAYRWSLMVDVEDPELWIERFQCASWVDYLRQRYRGTISDRAVWERVHAFHQGTEAPRVRRMIAQPVEILANAHHDGPRVSHGPGITDPALPPDSAPARPPDDTPR